MKRVACIGDSITWGFTIVNRRKYSYPSVLQEKLGPDYEVRNYGYNDASARFDADTPYVRKSVYRESLDWNPDIVVLMLGTNDTKSHNWDPAIFRKDYSKIVESYQQLPSHPRIVLVAPIRIFLRMNIPLLGVIPLTMEEGVRPAIREIAEEKSLSLIDLKDLFTDSTYMMDGVHPQREGAKMLAEAIFEGIEW
jgi:lysophospholipase L1-like esterase